MPRHGYVRKTSWKKAPKTAFKKGDARINRAGRKKGVQNKITVDMKQAFINALNKAGGEDYLLRQARRIPRTFLPIIGKMVPVEVTGKDGGPIDVLVTKAAAGLSGLSDDELKILSKLLEKVGITS